MAEIGWNGGALPTDLELVKRPQRRRYSAEYKLRIVQEADKLKAPGEVGALLRREGLYTSHLTYWRRQQEAGALQALGRRRGRKPTDPRDREIAELRQRLERIEAELANAREVIEIQGECLGASGGEARYRERALRVMNGQSV